MSPKQRRKRGDKNVPKQGRERRGQNCLLDRKKLEGDKNVP